MNKKSYRVEHKNSCEQYIVNCAGEKVPVAGGGFTARCAIGNTDDYLKSLKEYVNPEIVLMGEPRPISIVVPSYASDEHDLCETLVSLCRQKYPVPAEIVIFINEPPKASEIVRKANDDNQRLISTLSTGNVSELAPVLIDASKKISAVLNSHSGNIQLHCMRQVISSGLAGAYQIVMASSIARIWAYCDKVMVGCDRQKRIKCLERYLCDSMLLFCDDDIRITDAHSIREAYEQAICQNAVALGRLSIKDVTAGEYSNILRDLMQLFFELKYDHNLNFLAPRGILLADILKVGGIKIGQDFADQMFFASAARGKVPCWIAASTNIGESNHPGNGNFLKKLRGYLQGEDNDALNIFENVLKRYGEDDHKGIYAAADIENLIEVLRTRDIPEISSVTSGLLFGRKAKSLLVQGF